MSEATNNQSNRLIVILGLAMALGPLTALSFGTKYADDETWERAQAGLKNATPVDTLGRYGQGGIPSYASERTIQDVLAGSGVFDEFAQALKSSGADQILAGQDTYTIFVPSDEAFAKLPAEQREALLTDQAALDAWVSRHIVPGRYSATDLMQMREARTLDGEMIEVGPSAAVGGHIGVGGAGIVKSNIFAANGVVHVIDRAL
jgi:uncharacterized surface protein with fasciclin (FAS1) repeats